VTWVRRSSCKGSIRFGTIEVGTALCRWNHGWGVDVDERQLNVVGARSQRGGGNGEYGTNTWRVLSGCLAGMVKVMGKGVK